MPDHLLDACHLSVGNDPVNQVLDQAHRLGLSWLEASQKRFGALDEIGVPIRLREQAMLECLAAPSQD